MRKPRDKNLLKNPSDPEYDENYNHEDELYRYEMEIEMEEDERRGKRCAGYHWEYINNQ